MAVDFSKSKTRENLMRAFAGESQARNRYTIAAKQASRDNLYSISQIFLFTADQERAHAEVFYELLRGQTEQTIEICGGYPVNLAENVTDLLKSAVHNEMQEKIMNGQICMLVLQKLQKKKVLIRHQEHLT